MELEEYAFHLQRAKNNFIVQTLLIGFSIERSANIFFQLASEDNSLSV